MATQLTLEEAKAVVQAEYPGKHIPVRTGNRRRGGKHVRLFWLTREMITGGESVISGRCLTELKAWQSAAKRIQKRQR